VKPICGLCVKHDRPCDYTTPGRRIFEVSDVAINESLSPSVQNTPKRHSIPQASPQINPPREEPGEGTLPWTTSGEDPAQPLAAPLDPLAGIDFVAQQSPVTLCTDNLSPSDASYILQSVAGGSFSSPGRAVNAAAVWWFDLLANDAARENQQSSTIPIGYGDENVSFDRAEAGELTSLQRATQVLDGPRNADHRRIDVSSQIDNTGGELHIWQSQGSIDLLPREHFLFEHFVRHVSQWVSGACLANTFPGPSLIINRLHQIDLFDPTSQFSTFVAHLAVSPAYLSGCTID